MKASSLQAADVLNHLRVISDYASPEDIAFAGACLDAAKSYVRNHCNITDEYMDEHEELAIAVLVLAGDMFDSRNAYVDEDKPNMTLQTILGHHDMNMVEGERDAE